MDDAAAHAFADAADEIDQGIHQFGRGKVVLVQNSVEIGSVLRVCLGRCVI
jgi:hypothetical protein